MGMVGFHVLQMRILPAFNSHQTMDFAHIHVSFKQNPVMLPIYSLLFAAGTYHTFNGISLALNNLGIARLK